MEHPCIVCQKNVRPRQQALLCDGCSRWQHRVCNTGITQDDYREAVRNDGTINWRCQECSHQLAFDLPLAESSRTSEAMNNWADDWQSEAIFPTESEFQKPDDDWVVENQEVENMDTSMAIDFEVPSTLEESSLVDDTPVSYESENLNETRYNVISAGSQKNKMQLADSNGYTYVVKTTRKNGNVMWRCSLRNRNVWCKATVAQKGVNFTRGCQPHIHPGKVGASKSSEVRKVVKESAANEIFTSASEIVNRVMLNEIEMSSEPIEALQKPVNLARAANRYRQKMRPAEPRDLDFELEESHIPDDFFRKDLRVDGQRHLLFATEKMLNLLSTAKTWYMDGTFKIVKEPFTQLFSVHSFIRSGDDTKQIPLLFVLMSGRRKRDYKKLLEAIKGLSPNNNVRKIVIDFERAVWKAIPLVFQGVAVQGCSFHWAQCIWRKIQELGLATAYRNDEDTHKLCRQFLALPYLPHEHIEPMFERLAKRATTSLLTTLVEYIRINWIKTSLWNPETWSIFKQPIRTNNDVEGWHGALNRHARRGNLTFYLLVKLLHEQSKLIGIQIRLVSDNKLQRRQRKEYRLMHGQINQVWDSYIAGDKSARQVLRKCSHLVAPNIDGKFEHGL